AAYRRQPPRRVTSSARSDPSRISPGCRRLDSPSRGGANGSSRPDDQGIRPDPLQPSQSVPSQGPPHRGRTTPYWSVAAREDTSGPFGHDHNTPPTQQDRGSSARRGGPE